MAVRSGSFGTGEMAPAWRHLSALLMHISAFARAGTRDGFGRFHGMNEQVPDEAR